MEFSGLDLAAGRFTEISSYVVVREVIPRSVLELAAVEVIAAWPALALRVNALVRQ